MPLRKLHPPVEPLTVVTYKWKPRAGYRSKFGPEHVNTLARMIARHYPHPHRFVCVTDDPTGIEAPVQTIPLWPDYAELVNPSAPSTGPSCYRRLRMFARDAADWLGRRIVALDLDCVVTGDLTPIFHRTEPFVIWADTNPKTPYNGSLMLFTAGAVAELWEEFDPIQSPKRTRAAGYFGSDQAWISLRLGGGQPTFKRQDGVLSYRVHLKQLGVQNRLPAATRLVIFHGSVDPWSAEAMALPWVKENYR
jgi:hypothetical protein